MMIYTIDNGCISLSVTTSGGSMTSLKYMGEERLWQGNEFWKSQDVVIFPIVGHAGAYEVEGDTFAPKSHGVARYAEFTMLEKKNTKLTLGFASDSRTKETYPYDFEFTITYELEDNGVKITYFVKAVKGEIPFYVGGHPGMQAPRGEAVIEFENEENPLFYPLDGSIPLKSENFKGFVANKEFFKEYKTFQIGNLSGGKIYATTSDGYRYAYKSDCPVFAFWSNEEGGEFVCIEPWWGINDFNGAPKELSKKPFINFAGEHGREFSYTLTVEKI